MQWQFSSMHIIVDGSLNNPVVVIAVIIWSVLLAIITLIILHKIFRSYLRELNIAKKRKILRISIIILFLTYIVTPIAEAIIGNIIYVIDMGCNVSAKFWGGPPIWIAPSFGFFIGIVYWCILLFKKRKSV